MHNKSNGYFSKEGIPYHSVETLMVEAPDHGHQTTSEAYSYYIWLEAMHGAITNDFQSFNTAWEVMEKYIIPGHVDQPTNSFYHADKPATFAPEFGQTRRLSIANGPGCASRTRPPLPGAVQCLRHSRHLWYALAARRRQCLLVSVMHLALARVDPAPQDRLISTLTREDLKSPFGEPFLSRPAILSNMAVVTAFWISLSKTTVMLNNGNFTAAPDADARAIQAAYWAAQWAKKSGKTGQISETLQKAGKLGDYLRYALFDKYFKKVGNCVNKKLVSGR